MYSQKILKKDFFKYISGFLSEICGCTLSIEQIHNIYYKQFKNHQIKQPFLIYLLKYIPLQIKEPFLLIFQSLQTIQEHQLLEDHQNQQLSEELQNQQLSEEHQIQQLSEEHQIQQLSRKQLLNRYMHPQVNPLIEYINSPHPNVFLFLHMQNALLNKSGSTGNRYDDHIEINYQFQVFQNLKSILPFPNVSKYEYAILSYMPPYWYHIFEQLFNIPSYHTVLSYRNNIQIDEGFFNFIFNPQKLPLQMLFRNHTLLVNYIQKMWSSSISKINDNRFVLAIDAAALKVNVGIHPNGETFGLVDNVILSESQRDAYLQNITKFFKDYPKHAKYVFVFLLCPLNPFLKPIVLHRKYSTKGQASEAEIQDLEIIIESLKEIGLNCVGCASDGDPQYQSFSLQFSNWMVHEPKKSEKINEFTEQQRQEYELDEMKQFYQNLFNSPLFSFLETSGLKAWFQDVLHMLKNHRYHLIAGNPIKIFYGTDICLTYDEFLGGMNEISKYVFKNGHNTKMDDRLAFRFFDWSHIQEIINIDLRFIPILLPSSLLLQVFFNKKLTKLERYHLLNCGTAIVFIQRILYLEEKKHLKKESSEKPKVKPDKSQKSKKSKDLSKPIHPYDKTWMDKYLHLSSSLGRLFADKRSFDMSDCGSHLLEHLYGLIRRLCAGNDGQEMFDHSIIKAISLQLWLKILKLKSDIPGRVSQDSGAKIESLDDFTIEKCSPFGNYIQWALLIFMEIFKENNISFPNYSRFNMITEIASHFDPVDFNVNILNNPVQQFSSLNQLASVNTNGNRNDIRYSTINQDSQFMKSIENYSNSLPQAQNEADFTHNLLFEGIPDTFNQEKESISDDFNHEKRNISNNFNYETENASDESNHEERNISYDFIHEESSISDDFIHEERNISNDFNQEKRDDSDDFNQEERGISDDFIHEERNISDDFNQEERNISDDFNQEERNISYDFNHEERIDSDDFNQEERNISDDSDYETENDSNEFLSNDLDEDFHEILETNAGKQPIEDLKHLQIHMIELLFG